MKLKDLEISEFDEIVKITDLDNFFNVYADDKGNYKYNLNSTVYIDVPDTVCSKTVLQHDMHWTTASYAIYGTTHLAWLLMKVNKVKATDVFKSLKSGQTIKYINKEKVQSIIDQIY